LVLAKDTVTQWRTVECQY